MQAPICVIEAASNTSAFKQASLATTGKVPGKQDSLDLYKNSASSIKSFFRRVCAWTL